MARLENKVALITGAASNPGLGRSIALAFAREGAKLMITDINEAGLAATARDIEALGGSVITRTQDVVSESEWQAAIEAIETEFGPLDILVNNAGIAILRPVDEMTLTDYNRQMDINMSSTFLGCKEAIKSMRKSGGGSIINMSSVAGLVGMRGTGAYGASKAGVRNFSKTVALENASHNIRCNSVHPGVILTNIQQEPLKNDPQHYDALVKSLPMGRMGSPEEVANCVLFLASDESSYVSGTELVVDGCLTAQ
ncbi:MAG: SDR family NAD(P)-dependent oxidoreductase [Spongiibacteraceae bacterium]